MDELLAPFFIAQSVLFFYWLYLLVRSRKGESTEHKSKRTPMVSVVIPAYNEEGRIGDTLSSVLTSGYPKLEVIVVDDGSTDRTAEVAESYGVKVVKTDHVGKAEAVNRALPHVRGDIVILLDADTVIERGSIERIVEPLLQNKEVVISVGKMGVIGKGILASFQRIEYAFVSELLFAHTKNNKPLPFFFGAFMAVKRDFLEEIGGLPTDTPGEDFDLFIEAMERGKFIVGTDARARTHIPTTLWELMEQRLRWGKSGLLISWKHRRIITRYPLYLYPYWPIYGLVGFPNLLEMFVRYIPWHYTHGTIFQYILSWISYYGPISSLMMLPQWGFPPLTVLGVVLGMLSFAVLGWSLWREGGRISDFLYLFFMPAYGTFLMGAVLFLIVPYTILTIKNRKFIR